MNIYTSNGNDVSRNMTKLEVETLEMLGANLSTIIIVNLTVLFQTLTRYFCWKVMI